MERAARRRELAEPMLTLPDVIYFWRIRHARNPIHTQGVGSSPINTSAPEGDTGTISDMPDNRRTEMKLTRQ